MDSCEFKDYQGKRLVAVAVFTKIPLLEYRNPNPGWKLNLGYNVSKLLSKVF